MVTNTLGRAVPRAAWIIPIGIGCSFLIALPAHAGINLSWDHCGAAGVEAKSFACDTNEGYDVFVASIVAPNPTPAFERLLITVSFMFDKDVPAWWAFGEPG